LVLSKDDCKNSVSVSFKQIQNFEVLNLAMVKVKKVNIAVTYCAYFGCKQCYCTGARGQT
jgi:hypothetical protein